MAAHLQSVFVLGSLNAMYFGAAFWDFNGGSLGITMEFYGASGGNGAIGTEVAPGLCGLCIWRVVGGTLVGCLWLFTSEVLCVNILIIKLTGMKCLQELIKVRRWDLIRG